MVFRVAVVGAGASGLPTLKACLDAGLEATCFERFDQSGGLWNFSSADRDGRASVMKSTIVNTSKEMLACSDFPMPDEAAPFMHNSYVMDYFRKYIQHFGLDKHIQYKTEVVSVKMARDYDVTGRWDIRVRKSETPEDANREETLTFDGVLLCTGHHAKKLIPEFPGLSEFKGRVLHSQDYKDPSSLGPLVDKNVLIVGAGNSGIDIAVELGHINQNVFLSTRRGTWIFHVIWSNGVPYDMIINTRWQGLLRRWFPGYKTQEIENILNERFKHEDYGLKPAHRVTEQYPTLHDGLPRVLASGAVKVRPNVQRFTPSGVVFSDGSRQDVDVVIMATGYQVCFPMLDEDITKVHDNHVKLYKFVFVPSLSRQTLAMIGLIQPFGATMPTAEMQARWAVRVFKMEVTLPSREKMEADIDATDRSLRTGLVTSPRHTLVADFVDYMEEISKMAGCNPRMWRLFFTDPRLWYQVFFGPMTAYQFRLHGPNAWSGARKAIMTEWQRTFDPMKKTGREVTQAKSLGDTYRFLLIVMTVASIFMGWLFREQLEQFFKL